MSAQSARGLFRATGKAGKPKAIQLLDGSYAKVDAIPRAEHDFQATPVEPTRAFLHYERSALAHHCAIWEPAVGDGAMSREIKAAGHHCIGSDLIDRGCGATIADFFSFTTPLAQAIVTNPPYNQVNARDGDGRWVWHAMETLGVEYMALLLNWAWPGARGLAGLWAAHPPKRVYLMRWKIDFTGEGSPPMLHAWFIWERGFKGDPALLMMDRVDNRQGAMFAEAAP